jgi:UrcA family protein
MLRIIIATAALTIASAASANSEIVVDARPTAHVAYGDLDLHSVAGQSRLIGRIQLAANGLCIENNVEPLDVKLEQINCYQVALASGIQQMDDIAGQ